MRARQMTAPLVLALAACGGVDPGPPPRREPARMLVVNRSQYVLEELKIHPALSYAGAPNLLVAPLAIDGTFIHDGSGSWYVTVVREKYQGGPLLAFTTGYPVDLLDDSGYRLEVLDTSFRLKNDPSVAPCDPDEYPYTCDDAGVADLGTRDAGTRDAKPVDAQRSDAEPLDAHPPDAGARD